MKGEIRFLIIALPVLLLLALPALSAAGWRWLSPLRVAALTKEVGGLWLVDVRSPVAFAAEHIEGSVNIPVETLATKRLLKQKTVVLVDDSLGLRQAREAARRLTDEGMERIFVLEGGLMAWRSLGLQPAGGGLSSRTRPVTPEELAWARENGTPLRLVDLRDERERREAPFEGAASLTGATFQDRLNTLKEHVVGESKAGPVKSMGKPATVVVILPMAGDAREGLEWVLRGVAADVRYLEGGYAYWMAHPKKLKHADACPTCPGGGGGVRR